ncbi:MAG: hypothetical protein SWE60_03945 [Thermodesulfobacteriota bacterium]|nr:hypothetical protein [Thermodesulfobacteriota bacterium]
MPERNTGYYVLVVWGDVSPDLQGPFANERQRNVRAGQLKAAYGDEHGIYALEVDSDGHPRVRSYLARFFEDVCRQCPLP